MSAALSNTPKTMLNENINNNNNNERKLINNKVSSDKKRDETASSDNSTIIKVKSAIPRKRQDLLKWYGWGYKDSMFRLLNDVGTFTGDRYPSIGGKPLPELIEFAERMIGVDRHAIPNIPKPPTNFPECRMPDHIVQELEEIALISTDGMDRFMRAHGQTLLDMVKTRRHEFKRIPDVIIWPETHEQVVKIVECASRHKFVIIPFGGGTSVSGAVTCPENEPRPILVVDTTDMNSILWIDKEQLLTRVQAGIVGQDLEREMRARGVTVGHEPDSSEFSTLGGWIATRASGMKKNTYGNIEDLVVQIKAVTPRGVIERSCCVPRLSCGPDWDHVILGSEGSFGIVTEATLKLRPVPEVTGYGSLVFPDFEAGFHFEREVARRRLQPSSIRLIDNLQFRFGTALKPERTWGGVMLDGLKEFYLTKIKGFDPDELSVVTMVLEGTKEEVDQRLKVLNGIAAKYGGIPAGATNGERGYTLTYVIAYIRDLALEYNVVAESFETSVPWDRTMTVLRNVKRCVTQQCAQRGINYHFISVRLTQSYDAGCCLYFYLGFNCTGLADPTQTFDEMEEAARDEIVAAGGSISHHHGVGKIRKKWYTGTVSETGKELLFAAKRALDPDNIFALANMAFEEPNQDSSQDSSSRDSSHSDTVRSKL